MYKATEWQSGSGRWYVNDTTSISSPQSKWWYPMRKLNMSIEEYLKFLISYNAKGLEYHEETDFLFYYFKTGAEARKFKNALNKLMRSV